MLFAGILIGVSTTCLGFIVYKIFSKPLQVAALSEYDVEVKTPTGWHAARIKFKQIGMKGGQK